MIVSFHGMMCIAVVYCTVVSTMDVEIMLKLFPITIPAFLDAACHDCISFCWHCHSYISAHFDLFTVGDQSLHVSVGPCIVSTVSSSTLEHSGFAELYLNGVSM